MPRYVTLVNEIVCALGTIFTIIARNQQAEVLYFSEKTGAYGPFCYC